jgi:hypothetical protein
MSTRASNPRGKDRRVRSAIGVRGIIRARGFGIHPRGRGASVPRDEPSSQPGRTAELRSIVRRFPNQASPSRGPERGGAQSPGPRQRAAWHTLSTREGYGPDGP